jgi:hypothetical protein
MVKWSIVNGDAGDKAFSPFTIHHFTPYFGCILIAPSSLKTAPLIMTFRHISSASEANSSGRPRRFGKGTIAASAS